MLIHTHVCTTDKPVPPFRWLLTHEKVVYLVPLILIDQWTCEHGIWGGANQYFDIFFIFRVGNMRTYVRYTTKANSLVLRCTSNRERYNIRDKKYRNYFIGPQAKYTSYWYRDKIGIKLSLDTPWRRTEGTEVASHSFLILLLDTGEQSSSRSGRFTPGKSTRCPLHNEVDEAQKRSGRFFTTCKSVILIVSFQLEYLYSWSHIPLNWKCSSAHLLFFTIFSRY